MEVPNENGHLFRSFMETSWKLCSVRTAWNTPCFEFRLEVEARNRKLHLKTLLSFEVRRKSEIQVLCILPLPPARRYEVSFASLACVHMMVFIPKIEFRNSKRALLNINGDYGLPMKAISHAISTWLRPECRMGPSTVKETLQCLVWSDSCPRVDSSISGVVIHHEC